jgi:hypothetical protein|tara:strand:+ start:188 stop:997 length:810 start_codon:yes stop_codon:yes gene_type:complete
MAKVNKTVWLSGGFGNVMFQMLLVERFYNLDYNVTVVGILTKKNLLTKLLNWTIHEDITSNIMTKYPNIIVENDIRFKHIKSLFFLTLSKLFSFNFFGYLFFKKFNEIQLRNAKQYMGYFQSEEYIKNFSNEIKQISNYISKNINEKQNSSLVFHFRWGDTDWGRKYENYYYKIRELLIIENVSIRIVTDDLTKAKAFFANIDNIQFSKSDNPFDDFLILLNAETLILAPSTFSWWAAILTTKATKIYAPKEIISFLPISTNNSIVNAI